MKFEENLNRFELLDFLIRTKNTGSLQKLANRLGLSVSRTKDYINSLKEMGAPIVYSRQRESYIYSSPCELVVKFQYKFEDFS